MSEQRIVWHEVEVLAAPVPPASEQRIVWHEVEVLAQASSGPSGPFVRTASGILRTASGVLRPNTAP